MQRAGGEHWLLAPSSYPGLSITTSQILHLTCTISKSLAQVLLPCSPTNNTTLIFHAKPLGKPGFWGHTWRPPTGTENALLCTFCITWQGGRADSQSHCGCPSPRAPGGQQPSPLLSPTVPVLGWLLQTLLGWERRAPTARESGKEGGASGLPPLAARSVVCRWGACAIRGELVSPPTALQLPEDGLGWHTMCHCPGSWCV